MEPEERIIYGHAPTRRARETVEAIITGLEETSRARGLGLSSLEGPFQFSGLRNPDLYVGGVRVEMVSTAEAFADQTGRLAIPAAQILQLPFFRDFLLAPDRIGYWVAHPDPPGEDAEAVARRLMVFTSSLQAIASNKPTRFVMVTHSGPMRAFLKRYLLGYDPGEPDYVEQIGLTFLQHNQLVVRFRSHQTILELRLAN